MSQSIAPPPAGGGGNFTKLSKLIESNRIQVSFIEESMRKEVERNRQSFRFPATIAQALLHRHAAKFGFRKDLKGEIPVVCACCRMRMDNEPIGICYGTSESSSIEVQHNYQEFKLPPGVAVFFSILKATLCYLLIVTACVGYGFYSKDLCQILDLYPSWEYYRCPNPDPNPIPTPVPAGVILTVDILFLVGVLLSMVFFILYRKAKHAWHREIYARSQTEEAYTVLISNIPVLDFPRKGEGRNRSEFFYRKHLEDYLEERVRTWVEGSDSWEKEGDSNQKDYLEVLGRNEGELKSKAIVKSISLCYNLSRLEIIDDTRTALIEQQELEDEGTALIQDQNAPHPHPSEGKQGKDQEQDRFSSLPKKIDFINDCRIVLNNQYASDNSFLFNLTHFVGHAFVSFQYQHYRNYFLDQYQKDPKRFVYNGAVLKFSPAAGPGDVLWKNLRVGKQEKERLQLNSYFMILLVLIVEFAVLFGLHLLLYRVQSLKDLLRLVEVMNTPVSKGDRPRIFAIVASLVILFTNALLKRVISVLVSGERHKSKVNETTTYMNKSVLSQVLSSCLSLFLLDTLLGTHGDLHFYANNFIAISSGLELLFQLIQPGWVWKQGRRWWRYRGRGSEETVGKFQCQLNREYEYPQYELSYRYSYFLYKTYVALFFAFTAPLGLFFTLFTLGIMYWLDKCNLFSRSSLYYAGNLSVSSHALKMLQFSLLILAGSTFFFGSQAQGGINIPALCGVILAFLYELLVLAAPARLGRVLFGRETASDRFIYDDCVGDGKFSETYWNRNPATMLVQEESVTGKPMVTNPALMRRFANAEEFQNLL